MNYQDKIFIHLPSRWHSLQLKQLADKLACYQGVDSLPRLSGALPTVGQPMPQAAVLIVITNEPKPRLLLSKRSKSLSSHAGEVAFVGGHRDKTDTSTAHTALREGSEEVGLEGVSVIGYLPMQQSKSGLWVRPVVGVIEPDIITTLVGQACEIERIFWVPLDYFIDTLPSDYRFDYSHHGQSVRISTPAWYVANEIVWGLTARMIANLIHIGFGVDRAWYYRQVALGE